MNYQDLPHKFHIEETWIVCPADESFELKCYMLLDERGAVWTNGHPFGFIHTMNHTDHSSSDCRGLMMMRGSPEWTWQNDAPQGVQP